MTPREPIVETMTAPHAPDDVRGGVGPQPGLVAGPRRNLGTIVMATVAIGVLFVIMLGVVVYLVSGLGVDAFSYAGFLALIPLLIVALGIRWIDRWDPEPRGALAFAFLWGAGVSVLIALVVGAEIENVIYSLGGPGPGYEFFGAAIQAPVVEEAGKGIGVLLLLFFNRKHFDGPVDGIVYAATIAGGFAFTENILYFGQALLETGSLVGVVQIFMLRGLMSPFAHVMFTACIGIALGLAAHRTGALGAVGFFFLGLIPAIALHALWNGALFFVQDFYGYYAAVQVPLFIGAIFLVVYLRRKESQVTLRHLNAYANAGWFHPGEVGSLATASGRRVAMAWARTNGVPATMRQYIRDSTRLAFARQRMESGYRVAKAQADESALLASIVSARRDLRGK
jgi:RsiW-degrading membrane proteinase PrsW (M82 family)